MIEKITQTTIQKFIHNNVDKTLTTLALSKSPFSDVSMQVLVEQIEGLQKAKTKIPEWSDIKGIVYPPRVSMEQCSSALAARYKASLIKGNSILDTTGGFGIDTAAFTKSFDKTIYCEQNQHLTNIVQHNFKLLDLKNIDCFCGDAFEFLNQHPDLFFDWIYIDPARRDSYGKRVIDLNSCTPNVSTSLPLLFKHTKNILLKTSPMLDIKQVIKELNCIRDVYVVAMKNEVREVLYILEKDFLKEADIHAVHLLEDEIETFTFTYNEEERLCSEFSLPQRFLYEPNAAILKSGAFRSVCKHFKINKLHKNTHLYTSEDFISDFQGRVFEIVKVLDFGKTTQKELSALEKANITVRNFPDGVDTIRKKLKIKEGGEDYLFFTTLQNEKKAVVFCKKIEW